MGKKNTIAKSYMSDVRRFADAFNYYVFDGEQVIQAECLEQQDSTELSSALEGTDLKDIEKSRDLLKQCIIMEDDMASYVLLGLENQTHIHYAMPVRHFVYDALNYNHQYVEKAREHRNLKDLTGDEFLSEFSKTDKLKPIITLILYWGSKEWDGPRSLREMLDVKNETLLQHINEYPLHLIVPGEIEDFSKMHTELKKALRYIAVSKDKNAYKALAVNPEYRMIDRETACLLNTFMDTKISIKESEDEVDVCEAVKGIIEDAKDEGRIEGKIEQLVEQIRKKLSKGKSIAEIADALEESEEYINELIEKYEL